MPIPTSFRSVPDGLPKTVPGVFNVLEPHADLVNVEELATALSRIPLYPGETERFYSVAQHSLEVARRLNLPRYRLAALISCAASAYMGDISKIRDLFPDLAAAEARVQQALNEHFGYPAVLPAAVAAAIKVAELEVQATEHRDLLPPGAMERFAAAGIRPIGCALTPISQSRARSAFRTYLQLLLTTDLLGDPS